MTQQSKRQNIKKNVRNIPHFPENKTEAYINFFFSKVAQELILGMLFIFVYQKQNFKVEN